VPAEKQYMEWGGKKKRKEKMQEIYVGGYSKYISFAKWE